VKDVVRDAVLQALSSVRSICKGSDRWRSLDAALLAGTEVGVSRELEKHEAYRGFMEHLRGRLEGWSPYRLALATSLSMSRASATLVFDSTLSLVEREAESEEGGGAANHASDAADRLTAAVDICLGMRGWLNRVQLSLLLPTFYFVSGIVGYLRVEEWRDNRGYEEGRKRLGNLLARALINDRWVRERLDLGKASKWHYWHHYLDKRRGADQYGEPDWSDMVDKYAPHALCLYPSLDALEDVELAGGDRAWRIKLTAESLTAYAELLKKDLEAFSAPRDFFGSYYDFVSDVLSGGGRGVASPLESIESLWSGWVGALYPDLARASWEGRDALHLLMLWPKGRPPFDRHSLALLVRSLAANRQVAHLYSHTGWLLARKAREAADREEAAVRRRIFRDVARRLRPLYVMEGWTKYYGELSSVPERPLPSIHEQIFHTSILLVGMLYGALSSASTVVGLKPEIPADPLYLLKEQLPDVASSLAGPDFSQSLDLLRRSAGMPVGILERYYLYVGELLVMSALVEGVKAL